MCQLLLGPWTRSFYIKVADQFTSELMFRHGMLYGLDQNAAGRAPGSLILS